MGNRNYNPTCMSDIMYDPVQNTFQFLVTLYEALADLVKERKCNITRTVILNLR